MDFSRIDELRFDSAPLLLHAILPLVHRLTELVHFFTWNLHNIYQKLHNLLIALGLLTTRRWAAEGKSSETRSQRRVAVGVRRFFRGAPYAGGKSPTYRQRQIFKFDFVSFFSFQLIEQQAEAIFEKRNGGEMPVFLRVRKHKYAPSRHHAVPKICRRF